MRSLIPMMLSTVPAGFPSPADDYLDQNLDLHEYLIPKPSATFLAKAQGDSMMEKGIFDGDILVVDRSLKPRHGDVVVAAIDGEFTCKILDTHRRQLMSANPDYPPIQFSDMGELVIEGVVTHSIRSHRCSR
jgi:DNA polymerase V